MTSVLKKVPPPPLHGILLGPGNDIYDGIQKQLKGPENIILEKFENEIGITTFMHV